MKIIKQSSPALNEALGVLKSSGVAVCRTDTVYGFLADARSNFAVEKIFKIKKRPKSKPLAVFVCSLKQAKELAEISRGQEKIIKKHWPGKYTFVLRRKFFKNQKIVLSKFVTEKDNTIALRMPRDKFLLSLIKSAGPLAQTSANISGQPEINKIGEIVWTLNSLKTKPDLIIDGGNLPKRKPSSIIDLTQNNPKYIRK